MSVSDAQLVDKVEEEEEKKKVGKLEKENPEYTLPVSNSESAETAEDDISYISPGNLFFDVVLSPNQMNRLYMPKRIYSLLPDTTVPVVLRHGAKIWHVSFLGGESMPRLDRKWAKFVAKNHLKLGDACVFELIENTGTNLVFKVHLLRADDLPLDLLVSPGMTFQTGWTLETAICID